MAIEQRQPGYIPPDLLAYLECIYPDRLTAIPEGATPDQVAFMRGQRDVVKKLRFLSRDQRAESLKGT